MGKMYKMVRYTPQGLKGLFAGSVTQKLLKL